MSYRLAILFSAFMVAPALGQDESSDRITVDNVFQKNGAILSLKYIGNGKIKMKFQSDEVEDFILDWKTMIYKLTDRNRKIYKEQDKLPDIVKDVNKLKKRIKELPEKERDLIIDAWADVQIHLSATGGRGTGVIAGAGVDISWDMPAIRRSAKGLSQAQMDYWRDEEDRQNFVWPSSQARSPNDRVSGCG
jgi:hypothetical protein